MDKDMRNEMELGLRMAFDAAGVCFRLAAHITTKQYGTACHRQMQNEGMFEKSAKTSQGQRQTLRVQAPTYHVLGTLVLVM